MILLPFCFHYFGQVGAEDKAVLDKIVDSLTSLANSRNSLGSQNKENNMISLKVGEFQQSIIDEKSDAKKVLILGAGRVCRPAAELLASIGSMSSGQCLSSITADFEEQNCVQVIVASLYLKDAEEVCPYIKFH